MSLPPGFLDELRTRTSLSQVVGRKVMWDTRKSNQGKGDMWAPCPFHQEKTASFHVDDRKGFYYCFGCHAKGDAISFVKETENTSFIEAVEILAREAGMQMPARDPRAQQKADRRSQLGDVMEQAVRFFRLQLKTGAGGPARDYLDRRGLSEAARDRWEIGFAPNAWQALWDHLRAKDVAQDLILACGLAKPSSKGGKPYDTFRGRIMFPIRDARGRAIAFGGRAMDPSDNAKYLNSPETDLFDKGRSLYNHGPAREAAGKGQPLIVAEGYMDVIALAEAGFGATVAPLGTAITEDQLRLLWRIAPEPIIALDGDKAGQRAAMRLIDLAFPLLEAGQSLRFVLLPEGLDPDDLLKAQGRPAMQALIDAAQPMVNLLWQRETEGQVFDSPERKAMLDKRLRAALKLIGDPSIRGHYGEEVKRLRWELFGQNRRAQQGRRTNWSAQPAQPLPSTRTSMLASAGGDVESHLREAVILATLIEFPELLEQFEHELEDLEFAEEHRGLRRVLLRFGAEYAHDSAALRDKLHTEASLPLEKLFSLRHVRIAPPLRYQGNTDIARQCIVEELAKLAAERGVAREIDDAVQDMGGLADEGLTWRLAQAAAARDKAQRAKLDESATAEEDTDAMRSLLQNLIDSEVWVKKRR